MADFSWLLALAFVVCLAGVLLGGLSSPEPQEEWHLLRDWRLLP